MPILVIPYILAWLCPVIFSLLYLLKKSNPPVFLIRRAMCAVIALTFFLSICYIFFPVYYPFQANLSAEYPRGLFTGLVSWVYSIEPMWNASPSAHIAYPWLIIRIFNRQSPCSRLLKFFKIFFALTTFSVVGIKVHFVMDILTGIITGELVYQFIFSPLETSKAFEKAGPAGTAGCYLAVLLAMLFVFIISHSGNTV